jgi:hypothetical protein
MTGSATDDKLSHRSKDAIYRVSDDDDDGNVLPCYAGRLLGVFLYSSLRQLLR